MNHSAAVPIAGKFFRIEGEGTEASPAVVRHLSTSQEAFYASAAGGRVLFGANSEEVAVPAATAAGLGMLRNPPLSGVDLYLAAASVSADGRCLVTRFRLAAPPAVPTGQPRPAVSRGGGAAPAAGQFVTHFQPPPGGVAVLTAHLSAGGVQEDRPGGSVVLRPGQALYWAAAASPGLGVRAAVAVAWWELPAAA